MAMDGESRKVNGYGWAWMVKDAHGWSIEAQDPTVFRYTSNMLQAYFKHA